MESSKKDKTLEPWSFLEDCEDSRLAECALKLMDERVDVDNPSCLGATLIDWKEPIDCAIVKSYRGFSLACIEQAAMDVQLGNYKDSIALSTYSSTYNDSGDIEWCHDLQPLSFDRLDKIEYIKSMLGV